MSIRKTLIASSASTLMLFSVAQAIAADIEEAALPDLSAVMSMYGGGAFFNTSGGTSEDGQFDRGSHWLGGGDARVAGQSWQLEINTQVLGQTDTGDSGELSYYAAGAGHWLGRSDTGTWGLFAGLASASHQDSDEGSTNVFGGLEYAAFLDNSTFFGQAGGTYAIAGADTDGWEQGVFGRLGWRYFMSDYTKIEFDGTLGWGNFDSSSDGMMGAWGVELEHQFAAPFSGFVAYRGDYVEDSTSDSCCSDNEIVSHAFMVGFRVDVGTMSLLQRDRVGAGTFDLPDFHRAMAWPDELD